MEFKFELLPEKKMAMVKMTGLQDIDKFTAFYRELIIEIEGKGIRSILWDARELDVSHLTIDQINYGLMSIKNRLSSRKGGKAAWVVNDNYSFGVARMFQNMADGQMLFNGQFEFEIFKDFKKAEEWLCE